MLRSRLLRVCVQVGHIPKQQCCAHTRTPRIPDMLSRVESLGRGHALVRPPPANGETQDITHPFPAILTHSKERQRTRRKNSEKQNEQTSFPHINAEGHDGGKREGRQSAVTLRPKLGPCTFPMPRCVAQAFMVDAFTYEQVDHSR